MPKLRLTDIVVRNLKPTVSQTTYWDTASGLPGFNVRVSRQGTRTFTLVLGSDRRRITLGRYPAISLQEARKKAQRLLAEHTLNPHASSISFGEALDLFITTHCRQKNKPGTAAETERLLRRHFPEFNARRLDGITTIQVNRVIDALLDKPSTANHAFVALKTFFNWSLRRGYIQKHPLLAQQKPARCIARDRVLTEAEIASVVRAAYPSDVPFHQIVLLLLLTGQRRNEICGLRWQYIDTRLQLITLPSAVTKNSREHTFPYGEIVKAIIATVPRTNEFLFPSPSDPSRFFTNYTLTKALFDERCGIPHWTLHDLRRTYATTLASLKVAPHITERLLNHVSGTISGVAAIYNRWNYLDDMRHAVLTYEQHLQPLFGATFPPGAGARPCGDNGSREAPHLLHFDHARHS